MWSIYDKLRDIGVCQVSGKGEVMRSSPTFAAYFGFDRVRIEELNILDLMVSEDRPHAEKSFEAIHAGKLEEAHSIKNFLHPIGNRLIKTLHAMPLSDNSVICFTYEPKADASPDRTLLLELLRVLTKPDASVNVHVNDDHSQNVKADRGSTAKIGDDINSNTNSGMSITTTLLICILTTIVILLVQRG